MRALILTSALAALSVPIWAAAADDSVNADEIIGKFAAKEAEFAEARNNYTYRQSLKLEELDPGGNPTDGKWEEIDDIIFTPEGKRIEKVVYAPGMNLKNILLTKDDMDDLHNVQPFVLTTAEVPNYNINYLGKEKIDEIDCYLFSVKPKKLVPGKRYFEGQVWVDDRDLQIVKTYGKGVGYQKRNADAQFPKFETYREQIDGKYWFPTYTHADDTLHFKDMSQRIRLVVKYQDYKRFEGRSTIKYGDTVDQKAPAKK
jgi:hypothetical protein